MVKAPTKKSRMFAVAAVLLVSAALILDAWFSPPLLRISTPVLGSVALVLVQLAKQTREMEGSQIPDAVVKASATIANIEVFLALGCGVGVFICLGMELGKTPKRYEQTATVVTLCLFAFSAVVFRFTRRRFDALMRTAAVGSPVL